jgi:hypothetical protein
MDQASGSSPSSSSAETSKRILAGHGHINNQSGVAGTNSNNLLMSWLTTASMNIFLIVGIVTGIIVLLLILVFAVCTYSRQRAAGGGGGAQPGGGGGRRSKTASSLPAGGGGAAKGDTKGYAYEPCNTAPPPSHLVTCNATAVAANAAAGYQPIKSPAAGGGCYAAGGGPLPGPYPFAMQHQLQSMQSLGSCSGGGAMGCDAAKKKDVKEWYV